MSNVPLAKVEARYVLSVKNKQLAAAFQSNFDPEQVIVQQSEWAIRAIVPWELIVTVATGYILEEILLKPLLSPVLERFDWKTAVRKFFIPEQPYNIIIRIEDENLTIEGAAEKDQNLTAEIWDIIYKVRRVLKETNSLSRFSKVRIVSGKNSIPEIYCSEQERPTSMIDLKQARIIEITQG